MIKTLNEVAIEGTDLNTVKAIYDKPRAPPAALKVKSPLPVQETWRLGFDPWAGKTLGGEDGNPLQYSCLENPMDRGAWWAMALRAAKSRTRLKELSTHAHMINPQIISCSTVKKLKAFSQIHHAYHFYSTQYKKSCPQQIRKRNKRNSKQKGRSKSVIVCRGHDIIHRKSL